jgi:hypothetical protein
MQIIENMKYLTLTGFSNNLSTGFGEVGVIDGDVFFAIFALLNFSQIAFGFLPPAVSW